MKIVSEVNNFEYFKGKAIELIKLSTLDSDHLKEAISVLVLARNMIDEQATVQGTCKKSPVEDVGFK